MPNEMVQCNDLYTVDFYGKYLPNKRSYIAASLTVIEMFWVFNFLDFLETNGKDEMTQNTGIY